MKNQETKLTAKKENLSKVNTDKISKEIQKEKKGNVYKFDYELLDTDQLKKKRQNARNKVGSFVKNIINYSDLQKNKEELDKQVKEFKKFYKETYSLNDFSVKSLRNKVSEKEKIDLERMFVIVKKSLENKKKEFKSSEIQKEEIKADKIIA